MVVKHFRGRKANYILSVGLSIVIIFAIAIVGIVMRPVVKELSNANIQLNMTEKSVDTTNKFDQKYTTFWDTAFLMVFLAICLGLWMTSWYIDTHPMFFIIAILCMIVFVAMSMLLTDAFSDAMTGNELSSSAAEFVIIPFFMNNFVVVICVVAMITGVVLYAKTKSSAGGGVA